METGNAKNNLETDGPTSKGERRNARNDVEAIGGSERDLWRRYGIPPRGWQKLRWARKGPPYYRRPGSTRIYYIFAEVDTWIRSQKIEPGR